MSHIKFTFKHMVVRISGCERGQMAHIVGGLGGTRWTNDHGHFVQQINAALDADPACRFVARMHAQCEMGAWVSHDNVRWFMMMVYDNCTSNIQLGNHRESLLRVGMSNYGNSDRHFVGDKKGKRQSWLRLAKAPWGGWGDLPEGPMLMSYSTSGDPWGDNPRGWPEMRPDMEWTPKNWNDWRAE